MDRHEESKGSLTQPSVCRWIWLEWSSLTRHNERIDLRHGHIVKDMCNCPKSTSSFSNQWRAINRFKLDQLWVLERLISRPEGRFDEWRKGKAPPGDLMSSVEGLCAREKQRMCLDVNEESLQDVETSWLKQGSKIIIFAALWLADGIMLQGKGWRRTQVGRNVVINFSFVHQIEFGIWGMATHKGHRDT